MKDRVYVLMYAAPTESGNWTDPKVFTTGSWQEYESMVNLVNSRQYKVLAQTAYNRQIEKEEQA